MPIVDAFGITKKHEVMQDTWGHLYPQPGSKHKGKILVMSHLGDATMLDRHFGKLPGSLSNIHPVRSSASEMNSPPKRA